MTQDKCKDCLYRENCAIVIDDWEKEFGAYVKVLQQKKLMNYLEQSGHFVPVLDTVKLIVESCGSYKKDENAEFEGFDLILWQTIRLRKFMSILELAKMHQEGWQMVNGGFVNVTMEDIDGDDIILIVEHGKNNGDGKEVYYQKFCLPMKALNNKKITEKNLLKWLREY